MNADLDGDGTGDVTIADERFLSNYLSTYTSSGYLYAYFLNGGVARIDGLFCAGSSYGYGSSISGTWTMGPGDGPSGFMAVTLSGKPGVNAWLEVERRASGVGIGSAIGDPETGVYLTRVVYDHDGSEAGEPNLGTQYPTTEPLPDIPFYETFEELAPGDLDGQNDWTALAAEVQSSTAYRGSQAGSITNEVGFIQRTSTAGETGVWTDMRLQIDYSEDQPVPPADASVAFYVADDGEVMVYDGSTAAGSGQTVPEGTWVRFTTFSDYSTNKWKLYLQGVFVGEYDFYSTTSTAYSECTVKGDATSIDNFGLSTTQPSFASPATVIMVK